MPELPTSLWNIPQRFVSITHQLGRSWRRDVIKMTPEQIRATLDGFARLYPGQFGIIYERQVLGSVPAAKIHPKPTPSKTTNQPVRVLLTHGGGFAFGSIRTHRALATALSAQLDAEVWVPEYSLSPENPYPKALNELLLCYHELLKSEGDIWLMGDSAGANLTAVLMGLILEHELPRPAGMILLSPWIDLRSNSKSNIMSQAAWSPFERLDMLEYATHYLQDCSADDPKASPILASKIDWPPVYLEASKAEYLWADSDILAQQLKEASIPHQFRIEEGALHGWQLFPDLLPEAKRSIENIADFMRSHSTQREE